MTHSTIFMAYYDADPKGGGILAALEANRIETIVLRARQTPRQQIPAWVKRPKDVFYYFVVSADRIKDAREIARRFKDPYCSMLE